MVLAPVMPVDSPAGTGSTSKTVPGRTPQSSWRRRGRAATELAAAQDPVLAEGTRVGDFRIRGLLGEGATGQVYLAQDMTLGRRVALKLIKRSAMQGDTLERFLDEARTTASFNHPNIVTLHTVGEHDGRPYLALEYIDGESLRARLASGPLPVYVALRYCRAVAKAIAEAHRRGLVHTDLKPENIVIARDGRVRIVDFGLAKLVGGTPQSASGTPAYMAPERWCGAPPTGAIDIWALGVTLHELVTGRRPFPDAALALHAFSAGRLPPPELAAAPWASVVRDCLALDPAARPTAEELVRRLTALLVPVSAGSAGDQLSDVIELPEIAEVAEPGAHARRPELVRRYRDVVHAFYATTLPDAHGLAAAARALVADDPAWAHPRALLAFLEGLTTEAGREVLAAARTAVDPDRDPAGSKLLRAFELLGAGEMEASYLLLDDIVRGDGTDLLAGGTLALVAATMQRAEEAAAVVRRLHALYPGLVFGMDLAEVYRREGRDADAERAIREWSAAAPESVVARAQLARIEARTGRVDEARARAREAAALHRDRDDVLPDLFEAFVEAGQIGEARAIAERMLVGSPLSRARGRYRAAVTSVLQGRFAAAYDAVRRALAEHRAFGIHSELLQCLELARALAPLVAGQAAQRSHTEELAGMFANLIGDAGTAAATRFELALLDHASRGAAPPSIDEHLEGLEDGPVRDVARRRMLRAAAAADLSSAHEAVAAGFSAFEENTASLLALGLCARRVRELDLARRSLERAVQRWSSINSNQSSPYHAVLARFHLAGVLADLGERDAARAEYEAFLRCWSEPDRPVQEVAIARRLLEGDALVRP